MSESANEILTYLIPIIGLVIATITAVGVFYGPKLVARRQEEKERIKQHFNYLQDGAISPLTSVIANIGIGNSRIVTNSPESFAHLDTEQFECFQAHYPILGDKWQELAGKWTKQHGHVGGRWGKHNEKVEAFEERVEKFISDRLNEAGISLPIKPYQVRQEVINNDTPRALAETFYEQAQDELISHDFTKSVMIEDSDFYTLKLGGTKYASSKDHETVEKCKSIFTDIQNSPDFKKEASSIIREAKQIKDEFEELWSNLDKIRSRGLISKDSKYKFKPVKKCLICKELFY